MATMGSVGSWNPGEDLLLLIQQTQESIRHADNKSGLVLAASTILVSALLNDVHVKGGSLMSLALLAISVLALCATYALTFAALVSRFAPPPTATRFAWPWVVAQELSTLRGLPADSVRDEAWAQAHALARIALVKFRHVNRAMIALTVGAGAFVLQALAH